MRPYDHVSRLLMAPIKLARSGRTVVLIEYYICFATQTAASAGAYGAATESAMKHSESHYVSCLFFY